MHDPVAYNRATIVDYNIIIGAFARYRIHTLHKALYTV